MARRASPQARLALAQPSRLRHGWLNEHLHLAAWLLITVVYLVAYAWIHERYSDNYQRSIEVELTNAVKVYHWRAHPRTGELQLMVGETPHSQAEQPEKGPLGIGKLPSVRGLLLDADNAFNAYSDALSDEINRILDGFYRSPADYHSMRIELSVLAPKQDRNLLLRDDTQNEDAEKEGPQKGDAPNTPPKQLVLEVPAAAVVALRNEIPSESVAKRLIAALEGGKVHDVHVDLNRVGENGTSGDGEKRDPLEAITPDVIPDAVQGAGGEVCRRFTALGDPLREVLFKTTSPTQSSGNGKGDECVFLGIGRGDYGAGSKPNDGASKACPAGQERRCFHATLFELVQSNPGFFWLVGPFRWLEFIMLAGAGVLLRRLVDFGEAYARLVRVLRNMRRIPPGAKVEQHPMRWEPRESLRTLIYLVSAPVIAVVIIWILAWTELLSAELVQLGGLSANAAIPLAFLLGFFPDLGPMVLTRVVGGVFGDTSDTVGRHQKPAPVEEVTVAKPDRDTGSQPSFAAFRARVRTHATRPFRDAPRESA